MVLAISRPLVVDTPSKGITLGRNANANFLMTG